jgi:hypothetical protein
MSKWKDCINIYPLGEEIAKALQDAGKKETAKKKGREFEWQRFPLIETLARKIYTSIQKQFNPEGLTKIVSRGAQLLYKELVMLRKHVDSTEADVFFHRFSKYGKVFLITNSPNHSGIDVAIGHFQDAIENALKQKISARTSNNGLRVGCILLDPKYCGSVSGIMTKKKNRSKSDIPGNHVTNFFEVVLKECYCWKKLLQGLVC